MQLDVIGYEEIENEHGAVTLVMEKIPASVIERYPIEALKTERMLHMDMTRDPGRRSDAHIIRYRLARDFIRPGDTVLDVACGLGYGSAAMAYGSGAARIIGVDDSAFAIDYAKCNFAGERLDFQCRDGTDLHWLDDASIDYVVSLETLEHLPDPEKFLAEIARVLKPAGRIFVSVPNMWVDEEGRDPNPHHLHVYDLAKLKQQLRAQFELENVWEQTAGGAFKLPNGKRRLRKVDFDALDIPDPEWWLGLAMKSPTRVAAAKAYVETVHPKQKDESSHVADFGAWYDNPYLYSGLINRGARLQSEATLLRVAHEVIAASPEDSADRGGALCVLAYAIVEAGNKVEKGVIDRARLVDQISAYLAVSTANVHVKRWQISLSYALGLIMRAKGELVQAEAAFRRCVNLDPLEFSPLIATKTLAASLALAEFALARDDREDALRILTEATARATTIIGRDWPNVIGSAEAPLSFGLLELANVCDLAAECALQAEALRRGWSKSFVHARSQMAHHKLVQGLRDQVQSLLQLAGWWQAQSEMSRTVNSSNRRGLSEDLGASHRNLQEQLEETRTRLENLAFTNSNLRQQIAALQGAPATRGFDLIAKARRFGVLSRRFVEVVRTDGIDVAGRKTMTFVKGRAARRFPQLRRAKYLAGKFVQHARRRGVKSAFARAQQVFLADVPMIQRWQAKRAAMEFENAVMTAVEPRRVMLPPDAAHTRFAILVRDFFDGGLEKVVIDLAQQFMLQGVPCSIFVFGAGGRAAEQARALGCDVHIFNGDVSRLLAAAQDLQTQVVFTHHCYSGLEQLSQAGIKIVEVIHNAYHWQRNDSYHADLRARFVSHYVAVSGFVRDYAAAYLAIPEGRIDVIENGLSREGLIRPRLKTLAESRKATLDRPILVHLANPHPQKNHLAILQAFGIVRQTWPHAQLVFAGTIDGTTEVGRDLLAAIAASEWKQDVQCVGPLNRRALSHLLARAHVGLLPSMLEGFSIASLEYTYFGLPTVMSETGAARHLASVYQHVAVAENVAISLPELSPEPIEQRCKQPDPDTAPSIARAILDVLSNYERYAKHATQAGEAWRSYSIEITAQRYLDLVKDAVR